MVKIWSVLFAALTSLSYSPAARAENVPLAGSGQSFRDCPDCPEMVVIPAGSLKMGSPKTDIALMEQELPQHTVTFSTPFAVGKFAVKFEEWDACLADGGCGGYKPGDEGRGPGALAGGQCQLERCKGLRCLAVEEDRQALSPAVRGSYAAETRDPNWGFRVARPIAH